MLKGLPPAKYRIEKPLKNIRLNPSENRLSSGYPDRSPDIAAIGRIRQ
jgi:hypothetical protein